MLILSQRGDRRKVNLVRFAPDGLALLSATDLGLSLWAGLPHPGPPARAPGFATWNGDPKADFAADGRVLHTARPLALWNRAGGPDQPIRLFGREYEPCVFALTPDRTHVVAAQSQYPGTPAGWLTCRPLADPTAKGALWTRDLTRPILQYPVFLDADRFFVHDSPPWDQPDRHRSPLRAIVCSVRTGEVLDEYESHELGMGALRASLDGTLVAGLKSARVVVFAVGAWGKPLAVLKNDSRKEFTDLAFHPSGRLLAATSNDHTVKLYDTATWELARTFTWEVGRMRSIDFSPDGTLAAVGTDKGQIVVWDVDV